jgi:hypothetical protein
MDCQTHPGVAATAQCAGCAEPFCANCLVMLKGAQYCGSCKSMAVSVAAVPILQECQEAAEALKYALVGIVCLGIILEPMAISKALKARQLIAANPTLGGKGKATAALVIGIIALTLWVLGMVARLPRNSAL